MAKTNATNDEDVFTDVSEKKKNPKTKAFDNSFLDVSDDELLNNIPDINKDFESPPEIINNPTETKVAHETFAHTQANTTNTEEVKTEPTVNTTTPEVEEKYTEKAGDVDVSINIPKKGDKKPDDKTKTNNQPPPNPQEDKDKFKVDGLNEPKFDGTSAGGTYEDIWSVDPEQPKTSGGGSKANNGDTPGIERPDELANSTNEGLAKWGVMIFETKIIGGIKNRAIIGIPKFMRDMMAENIRRDFQDGFLRDVQLYNERVDGAVQITGKEKALVKHCIIQILEKYPMIGEGFSPEIQALLGVGEIVWKYWNISAQWKEAQLDLLDRMDERLARAPKESPYTSSSEAKEEKTSKKD